MFPQQYQQWQGAQDLCEESDIDTSILVNQTSMETAKIMNETSYQSVTYKVWWTIYSVSWIAITPQWVCSINLPGGVATVQDESTWAHEKKETMFDTWSIHHF